MRGRVRLLSLACGEPLKVLSRAVRWSEPGFGRVAGRGSGGDRLNRGAAGHWARPQMAMNSGQSGGPQREEWLLLCPLEIFVLGAQGWQGFVFPQEHTFWSAGAGRKGMTYSRSGGEQGPPGAALSQASHWAGCSGLRLDSAQSRPSHLCPPASPLFLWKQLLVTGPPPHHHQGPGPVATLLSQVFLTFSLMSTNFSGRRHGREGGVLKTSSHPFVPLIPIQIWEVGWASPR